MDLEQPTTTTEALAIFRMVQYYSDMWTSRSHVLSSMTEVAIISKGRDILWNSKMKVALH